MDRDYFYEVLYGVFEKDTEHFLSFIETEHLYMLAYEESEREIYKAEINNQIEYIFKRIKEEDALDASSKRVELLRITKSLLQD
ncbi:MAG: hypothetical protein ACI4ON_02110 [Clostridia bacterium]